MITKTFHQQALLQRDAIIAKRSNYYRVAHNTRRFCDPVDFIKNPKY